MQTIAHVQRVRGRLRVKVYYFTVIVISTNPNKVDFSYIDYLALAHTTNTPTLKVLLSIRAAIE